MLNPSNAYVKPLGNGFILKSVSSPEDVERVGAFNEIIFGESVKEMARALILKHPHTRGEHWLFAEEESTGQVVASLCLIPWRWRYAGVELRSGELGVCGSLEAYRHRGLIRSLFVRHKELLREGEYHLSHIQGIPYFYRQFDYEYAMPLEGGWEIELRLIPDEVPAGYTFRLATLDDIPALIRLYDEAACDFDVSSVRDADIWRYLLQHTYGTGTAIDVFVIQRSPSGESPSDEVVGYFFVPHEGFGEGLIVSETSRLDHLSAIALLPELKRIAVERRKPYIRLSIPDKSTLIRAAADMGAQDHGRYQWQMHIPDVPRLLKGIAPVLEARLAASPYADLTQTVIFNLYKLTYALRFDSGRLRGVDAIGFTHEGSIHIPPLLFAPLVLGWRSREHLSDIYPDFRVWGESQSLIDVLFPKMDSRIATIY